MSDEGRKAPWGGSVTKGANKLRKRRAEENQERACLLSHQQTLPGDIQQLREQEKRAIVNCVGNMLAEGSGQSASSVYPSIPANTYQSLETLTSSGLPAPTGYHSADLMESSFLTLYNASTNQPPATNMASGSIHSTYSANQPPAMNNPSPPEPAMSSLLLDHNYHSSSTSSVPLPSTSALNYHSFSTSSAHIVPLPSTSALNYQQPGSALQPGVSFPEADITELAFYWVKRGSATRAPFQLHKCKKNKITELANNSHPNHSALLGAVGSIGGAQDSSLDYQPQHYPPFSQDRYLPARSTSDPAVYGSADQPRGDPNQSFNQDQYLLPSNPAACGSADSAVGNPTQDLLQQERRAQNGRRPLFMYEQPPAEDPEEEKKRKRAVRARKQREKRDQKERDQMQEIQEVQNEVKNLKVEKQNRLRNNQYIRSLIHNNQSTGPNEL